MYSQGACPATLVSLYRGPTKVLTNSLTIWQSSRCPAIVLRKDKNQVAGLEMKDTMFLWGWAAQKTHNKNIAVEQIREVQFGDHQSGVHPSGVWAEFLTGQGNYEVAGDNSTGDSWDMRGSQADLWKALRVRKIRKMWSMWPGANQWRPPRGLTPIAPMRRRNRCIIPNLIIPNGRFSYVHYSYIAIFLRFKIPKVPNS